jgi:hypothetical protein
MAITPYKIVHKAMRHMAEIVLRLSHLRAMPQPMGVASLLLSRNWTNPVPAKGHATIRHLKDGSPRRADTGTAVVRDQP